MLEHIIGSFVITLVDLYLWQKLSEEKIDFKNFKTYIGIIFMTIMLILNFFLINPIIKALTVILIVTFSSMYMLKISLKEAMVIAVINQALYIISEIIVVILFLIITNIQNKTDLVEMVSGKLFSNIFVSFFAFCFSRFKFVKKTYIKIISVVKEEKKIVTVFIVIMIVATFSIFFNLIYFKNDLILLSFIGFGLLIAYLVFIIKTVIMRNNYLNMHIKYNNTLDTLKSYEDIMDKYKVSNHENKNQLLMIRNMLKKDTKNEVSKYIDKIVENEYKDDEHLMMETSKIPSGGLRALIYSKLLYMKNKKINFDLKVDRKIRNVEFNDSEQELILDICKIVGVFLDNAIQAVKDIEDGSVSIELYMLDDNFNISIANIFEGVIELDKIDEARYTTKGEGHGYGLSLVKTIINKNSRLENIRKINDNVFVQILKIEI